MIDNGKKVTFAYTVKIGGEDTPSAVQKAEYEHGKMNIIPQLEEGLAGLEAGEKKTIKLSSEEGHIPYEQDKVKEVSKSTFEDEQALEVGKVVQLKGEKPGQLSTGTITEIEGDKLVVDFNHPLAGKDVEFNVEVLSIEG